MTEQTVHLTFADLAASWGVAALGSGEGLWHAINFLSRNPRKPIDIASFWAEKLGGVLPMISTTPVDNHAKIYGDSQGVSIGVVFHAKSKNLVCHAFCKDDCGVQNPLGTHEDNGVGKNETEILEWQINSTVSSKKNFRGELGRLKAMVKENVAAKTELWIDQRYFDADADLKKMLDSNRWLHEFNPADSAYPGILADATEVIVSAKIPEALLAVGLHFQSAFLKNQLMYPKRFEKTLWRKPEIYKQL